jgi:nitrite reductase/ring-hydroxylating ferredoxin subunit
MKIRFYPLVFSVLLLSLAAVSCGKNTNAPEIPDVPFSFVIDPNSTEYLNLNHIGGWMYLTGGYRGLIVYRLTTTQFAVYDRACPYDYETAGAVVSVDDSGLLCVCPVCGTTYSLLDGTPTQGPGSYPLKPYNSAYDNNLLYVYN